MPRFTQREKERDVRAHRAYLNGWEADVRRGNFGFKGRLLGTTVVQDSGETWFIPDIGGEPIMVEDLDDLTYVEVKDA